MPIERNQEAAHASPETHGLVGSFLQTAAYEGLQAPIKGVAQIVDQASGSTKLAKSLTFMEAPVKAEFNSAAWYGQQFGSAGKLVPFIAAYAVTHKAFGAAGLKNELTAEVKAGAQNASRLLGKNSLLVAETAVAGFGTEAIFKPLEPNFAQSDLHLSNSDFLTSRLKNGAVGAITFASLTTGTLGLRQIGLAAEKPLVNKLLTNNAFGAAVAGIPTGLISAETHARIIEGRSATNQERVEAAYSMFLVGGALGGLMPAGKAEGARTEAAKTEVAKSEALKAAENVEGSPSERAATSSRARPAFEAIKASIQEKIGTSYQRFDNFMASINPLLHTANLEPAYASRGNSLGSRAMQATLTELGRPSNLENRSLSVKSSAIESGPLKSGTIDGGGKAEANVGKQKDDSAFSDEAYDRATGPARKKAGDKAADKLAEEVISKPALEKASTVLEQMGLREVAEFIKGDRVLRNQTVVKSLGHGNDSPAVLELAKSAQFPHGGALKVTIAEGGWEPIWGKRPGDAKIYGKVHEVELAGSGFSGTANLYVQELAVVGKRYSPDLVDALHQKLDSKGLEITDVGSGIEGQVGLSKETGELVVLDYPSVTKRGQGNETLEAIRGGKQRVEDGYDAENNAIRRGKNEAEETAVLDQEVDLNLEIKRQDALRGDKFTAKEKDILEQFTQGFSAKEIQMMTALVEGKFDAKGNPDLNAVKPMVDAVLKKARAQGLIEKSKRSDNSFKISDDYRSDPFDQD